MSLTLLTPRRNLTQSYNFIVAYQTCIPGSQLDYRLHHLDSGDRQDLHRLLPNTADRQQSAKKGHYKTIIKRKRPATHRRIRLQTKYKRRRGETQNNRIPFREKAIITSEQQPADPSGEDYLF